METAASATEVRLRRNDAVQCELLTQDDVDRALRTSRADSQPKSRGRREVHSREEDLGFSLNGFETLSPFGSPVNDRELRSSRRGSPNRPIQSSQSIVREELQLPIITSPKTAADRLGPSGPDPARIPSPARGVLRAQALKKIRQALQEASNGGSSEVFSRSGRKEDDGLVSDIAAQVHANLVNQAAKTPQPHLSRSLAKLSPELAPGSGQRIAFMKQAQPFVPSFLPQQPTPASSPCDSAMNVSPLAPPPPLKSPRRMARTDSDIHGQISVDALIALARQNAEVSIRQIQRQEKNQLQMGSQQQQQQRFQTVRRSDPALLGPSLGPKPSSSQSKR